LKVDVSECSDLNSVIGLFDSHRDAIPFAYSANTQLFRVFSRLESCKIFEAKACGATVGCIYTMKYMYDYGWIGGLLVHKDFRRKGIGRKLLDKASEWFDAPYIHALVELGNTAARELFGRMGFNTVYRRLNYRVQGSTAGPLSENESVNYEFQWSELAEAVGFKERDGIVNLGFYPVKLTKAIFDDLKNKGRVLRFGDVVAVVENSYVVGLGGYTFIFNDHILNRISLPIRNEIVEVNPFYIKHETSDLVKMLKSFARKEVTIWTYEGDPVASRLPLRGSLAALVLELYKNVQSLS